MELNRAVAIAMAFGPAAGLELVDALTSEPSLENYHLLPSVRGDFLFKLGRFDEARAEFERAASLTRNSRERELLLDRARALQVHKPMCRNIKTLFNFDPPVTDEEVRAASLQFVRKISGFNKPSKANEKLFQAAVDEIAGVSTRLLLSLETNAPPKNREEEAAKAKARSRRAIRQLAPVPPNAAY